MFIYHANWIPSEPHGFDNSGQFVFWIETSAKQRGRRDRAAHPRHLYHKSDLESFFQQVLPLNKPLLALIDPQPVSFYLLLPTSSEIPLPSLEMAQLTGESSPDTFKWQNWKIRGIQLQNPLAYLKEIQFLALYDMGTSKLGADLQFWIQYAKALRQVVLKHQYIPALRCYRKSSPGRKKQTPVKIYPGWEPLSPQYEQQIKTFTQTMPGVCAAVSFIDSQHKSKTRFKQLNREDLLRNFSEQTLETLIANTAVTQKLQKQVQDTWVADCITRPFDTLPGIITEKTWQQWSAWKTGLLSQHRETGFLLGIRLVAAEPDSPAEWALEFFIESRQDPSLKLSLADYWPMKAVQRTEYAHLLGKDFEKDLLLALGQAARISPILWEGLETEQPSGVVLTMEAAFEFLKNDAWVLEDAGFKVSVPAWWTPKGRQRARIRIRSSAKSVSKQGTGKGYFDLPSLVNYKYQLSIGGQPVSQAEWRTLVNAKSPLIHFRGQWMELDREQMEELLTFWQQHKDEDQELSMLDFLKQAAEADETSYEFAYDKVLTSMLGRLRDDQQLAPMNDPPGLDGDLREYQKRGLSWLAYLESLKLNPCLADDMGLGKTIQVIALLLLERANKGNKKKSLQPTLLIAPTSVLGNWQKEIQRFAPQLNAHIHHGSQRSQTVKTFSAEALNQDILITSFTLARKDAKLLDKIAWHRIVVDEAQNIKNPKTAQTRAIVKFKADHRLALTGTPIENRLMDLWSIFHFLNPGYLGTATQFKKQYETPIEKDNDGLRSERLKRLVTPFILRRLKTDKSIIKDLPDKIEQKVYCNLTQEQASLYQAVVDDVQEEIESVEGIQRKGLILSTLTKLKQICNHPAQFLQDSSSFSESRSHKLARISEMVAEAIEEGDSVLLFTQFTEIGSALVTHFRGQYHYPTHYLHGGTQRHRREKMIAEFQDETSPPTVFILSLKAGGVGITLTKANHVFHFDRWWNPAVENQATDRAFRIGQKKKVFAHKMVALGTLEERIDQMLEEKQKLAESIVGSDESWLTKLDNAAFRRLIELNRSTVLEA